jgi:hypothetical protein
MLYCHLLDFWIMLLGVSGTLQFIPFLSLSDMLASPLAHLVCGQA